MGRMIQGTRYTQGHAPKTRDEELDDFGFALTTLNPLMTLHELGYDCSTAKVVDVGNAPGHSRPGPEWTLPQLVKRFGEHRERVGAGSTFNQYAHRELRDVVLELRRRGALD
jgi:hypothetical protein